MNLGTFPGDKMISEEKIKYLKLAFSDADLVDVDLSWWDSVISLYVLADHVPRTAQGKRTILAVRFRGVRKFDWSFPHHDFKNFPLYSSEGEHLNWNIYRINIIRNEISELTLSGSEQFPILKICFEDLDVEPIEEALFSSINPQWYCQGDGLARPSIERLYLLKKRKGAV